MYENWGRSDGIRGLVQLGHKTLLWQKMGPKRPRPIGCKFIQINLHHNQALMAFLHQKLVIGENDIALIQETWIYGDCARGQGHCSLQDPVLLLDPAFLSKHSSCQSVITALL